MFRACSVGTVPFRSLIQMARFLPFQNGKNPLFTVETVAERNGTVPTEQALNWGTMGLGAILWDNSEVVDGGGARPRSTISHDAWKISGQ